MNIQTDRALVPAGSVSVRYLTVAVTAPARERRANRPAVDVALVLDRSGSMAGRKIDMARTAVEQAIRLLEPSDRLALVCYDNEIDTLLGATAATKEAKTLALSRLRGIDARGSTDLCGGWLRGAEQLAAGRNAGSDRVSRVLLLSDGLANAGETDAGALARHAARLRAQGIATSTFGLGADFDEVLMSRLATDGGGHFYFIEQPAQIPDFLTSELGDALEVVARNARLVVSGAAGVVVSCLNDFPVESRPGTGDLAQETHVRLGDLISGQELTVTLAVRCPALHAGDVARISVRLADRDQALFPEPMPVDWRAADDGANAVQAVNAEVIVAAATCLVERARSAALNANRRGDFAGAKNILKSAVAELRAMGAAISQVKALASELEANDTVDYAQAMAPLAMKARHMASYSALRERSKEGKAKRSS